MKKTLALLASIGVVCLAHAETLPPKVWQPKPAKPEAPVQPILTRIVKQGMEHMTESNAVEAGIGHYSMQRSRMIKNDKGIYKVLLGKNDWQEIKGIDVDEDGDTTDDVVGGHMLDFSPDNPMTPILASYDTSMGTQRHYGCGLVFAANSQETMAEEDGMNGWECMAGYQPLHNWTFLFKPREGAMDRPYRTLLFICWQKFDFNNGGDKHKVTFNDDSELRMVFMRVQFGTSGMRWVVRDGEQFYISEETCRGLGGTNGVDGLWRANPAKMKWAAMTAKPPCDVYFDPEKASFAPHEFKDVTAVGFYKARNLLCNSRTLFKWISYEADAVVHRPFRPSEMIDMVKVEKPEAPPFYMSTCEVPYELWRKLRRAASTDQPASDMNRHGTNFKKMGEMGSMGFTEKDKYLPHDQQEPVTGIPLLDMMAWCNALSVYELRTPCYYEDAEFKKVFRDPVRGNVYKNKELPVIYVKWSADGYRLPTASEWSAAAGGDLKSEISNLKSTPSTKPVGSGKPNAQGLYDMAGNVWEMVWTHGDKWHPTETKQQVALGGDFRSPAAPESSSSSAYGDRPFNGSGAIGFRVVRRDAGGKMPPSGEAPKDILQWAFGKETLTAPDPKRQLKGPLATPWMESVSMDKGEAIGKYEVTFEKWKPVYDWATAHGYEFDYSGDMGSMAYWGFGEDWKAGTHSPQEPVTSLSVYDVMLWCNALSELEGKKPVFYEDEKRTSVLKKSYLFRSALCSWLEAKVLEKQGVFIESTLHRGANVIREVHVDIAADGYRYPTEKEYVNAIQIKLTPKEPMTEKVMELGWVAENADFRTHAAGLKPANASGLFDVIGNASEMACDIYGGKVSSFGMSKMGGGFMTVAPTLTYVNGDYTSWSPQSHCGFRVWKQK